MLPDQILAHPAEVLSQEQRLRYFEDGFLILPDYVPASWLQRLRAAMAELVERSRAVSRNDGVYVLEEGHTAETPRLHRVTSPQDQHPAFWEFFCAPLLTSMVADVVGPDVKFHHAKLNVKAAAGTRGFDLHQDCPGWPHTDYSPVTVGIYLEECTQEQGPLSMLPGTSRGPLFSLYDDQGEFAAQISRQDLAQLDLRQLVPAVGGAGTVVLLNCRTVHGSKPNTSSRARPLLLPVYSSADSFPYTYGPIVSPRMGDIVRGRRPRFASFDPRPCELPPDFRGVYRSPFETQRAGSMV